MQTSSFFDPNTHSVNKLASLVALFYISYYWSTSYAINFVAFSCGLFASEYAILFNGIKSYMR